MPDEGPVQEIVGAAMDNVMVNLFLETVPSPLGNIWLDATDDPLHGNQEERFFHDCRNCYLPLYLICGDHVSRPRLRPAIIDAAVGSVEELARIVGRSALDGNWYPQRC